MPTFQFYSRHLEPTERVHTLEVDAATADCIYTLMYEVVDKLIGKRYIPATPDGALIVQQECLDYAREHNWHVDVFKVEIDNGQLFIAKAHMRKTRVTRPGVYLRFDY